VSLATLWRWVRAFTDGGVAGLVRSRSGPKGPSKLTAPVAARIVTLGGTGMSLAGIAAATGVSTATVRVALGRVPASTPNAAAGTATGSGADVDELDDVTDAAGLEHPGEMTDEHHPDRDEDVDGVELEVLAQPVPRMAERAAARGGDLVEAPVQFTQGAQLPLVGVLLGLPALAATGLLESAAAVFAPMRKGFYGLRAILLTGVFLALLREPRAEGATRIRPADLGRILGLDRAPEVKTIRRKLAELAACGRGAQLQAALAAHHVTIRPDAVGFFYVDGHVRVYTGTRQLPKTHIARMRIAGPATEETWVADTDGDPVLVVTAPPSASLAGELRRLLPDLRKIIGAGRRATVVFDRGGYSPTVFAEILAADFDLLTYYKGTWTRQNETAFTTVDYLTPEQSTACYQLAERPIELAVPARGDTPASRLTLRLVIRRSPDGHQTPILTNRTDLSLGEIAYRMSARWRQENYFKYARQHFALDALDSYADTPDDPARPVPNPAKATARQRVQSAQSDVADAHTAVSAAIDEATARARRPGAGGTATVDPAAAQSLTQAHDALDTARATAADTASHVPLGQVRPQTRLLETERKLLTHAIRTSAYNTESTLARLLRPHYARGHDEARALLREAFTLPGDLQIIGDTLHVRLDPASAPRRSRAIAALCAELTATHTRYPDTDLTLAYSVKDHPTDA